MASALFILILPFALMGLEAPFLTLMSTTNSLLCPNRIPSLCSFSPFPLSPLCFLLLIILCFASLYPFESSGSWGIVMHCIVSSPDEEQGCRKIDKISPYWDFPSEFYIKENPAYQNIEVNFLLMCLLWVAFSKECLTPSFPCPQFICTGQDPFPNLYMV